MNSHNLSEQLLEAFGPSVCSTDQDVLDAASADAWKTYAGRAAAVMRPRNVDEVSAVVKWCHEKSIAVVPQGGNTGVAGGAIPDNSGQQVVLSLGRLNRIREIDAQNYTATVEAGCVLAHVRSAVSEVDRLFPLSFGAEGSCQIGGVLSTNAGGINTLRYGNARDLALGLEVVLADGTIWHGLRKLRKDNTGYDLRQLFIGAEGTLGVITAAVLKLFPAPKATVSALIALADLDGCVKLLSIAREYVGEAVSAFELIPQRFFRLVNQHVPGTATPLTEQCDWFVLAEFDSGQGSHLEDAVQSMLEAALEREVIIDAAVSTSVEQRNKFWELRESVSEAQIRNGAVVYTDVSVAVSMIPDFIRVTSQRLAEFDPAIDINAFGHVGDGNIHFNVLQPPGADADAFLATRADLERVIYTCVHEFGGSISAEHGIGQSKIDALFEQKLPFEMAMMRRVREVLAGNAFNPNKVIPL